MHIEQEVVNFEMSDTDAKSGPELARQDRPILPARDCLHWSRARKLKKFATCGGCRHVHRKYQTTLLGLLCYKHEISHSKFLLKRNLFLYNKNYENKRWLDISLVFILRFYGPRISSKSVALIKRVWTNDIERAIGQCSNCFYVCQFGAKSISV